MSEILTKLQEKLSTNQWVQALSEEPVQDGQKFTCRYFMQNPDGSKSTTLKSVSVAVPTSRFERDSVDVIAGEVIGFIRTHIERDCNIIPFPKPEKPETVDVSVILNHLSEQQKVNEYLSGQINQLEQKLQYLNAVVYCLKQALDLNDVLSLAEYDQAWDIVVTQQQIERMKSLTVAQKASDQVDQTEDGKPTGEADQKQDEEVTQSTSLISHMLRRIRPRPPTEVPSDSA